MTDQSPPRPRVDRSKGRRANGAVYVPVEGNSGHAAIPLLADPDTDTGRSYYQGPPERSRHAVPSAGR